MRQINSGFYGAENCSSNLKYIKTVVFMVMQQYVMNAEPSLIKEVDAIIKEEKQHSSRNEFIRDAIRRLVIEYNRANIKKISKRLGEEALRRGWNGEMPTKEERIKIADEYLEEHGYKRSNSGMIQKIKTELPQAQKH